MLLIRNLIGLFALSIISVSAPAQQRAITDSGDEIIVYPNGTWKYADTTTAATKEIKLNNGVFKKSPEQTFGLKSKVIKATINLDSKKWNFEKAAAGEATEYSFTNKEQDIYGMVIAEKLDVTPEGLADIAFTNAKSASADVTIDAKEYRTVNGLKVVYMRFSGTISSLRVTYEAYYGSAGGECFQFLAYCATSNVQAYQKEIDKFLNGIVFPN